MGLDDDFYKVRRRITTVHRFAPEPIGWDPTHTATGNPTRFGSDDDPWDNAPSRNPFPPSMPGLHATTAGATQDRDIHLTALHQAGRVVHEDAILYDGGDHSRLRNLKRGIQEVLALTQEQGTNLVELSEESKRYLDELDGDETGMREQGG